MASDKRTVSVTVKRWFAGKGYGFISTHEYGDVYCHAKQLRGEARRLADSSQLEGKEVVISQVLPAQKQDQRPSGRSVFTLTDWEREQAKHEAQERRQVERETEESQKKALRNQLADKFSRIREAYPSGLNETAFKEASTVHLEAGEAEVLEIKRTWHDDRNGAAEISYSHYLILKGVYPLGGAEFTKGVLVHVEGYLKTGNKLRETPTGDTLREAVSSDSVWPDEYRVSPEDAERLWQHCRWYLLPTDKLQSAREAALQVLEACRIWEEEFPGVAPGNQVGAVQSTGLRSSGEGDWVWHRFWHVPPFLLIDKEEIWIERDQHLQELVKADDEKARKIMAEESVGLFWKELIVGLEKAISPAKWDRGKMWSSDVITEEKTVPVWAAFVGDKEVARLQVWYTQKGGISYYRLFERDVCAPDGVFVSGSIEWRVVDYEPTTR